MHRNAEEERKEFFEGSSRTVRCTPLSQDLRAVSPRSVSIGVHPWSRSAPLRSCANLFLLLLCISPAHASNDPIWVEAVGEARLGDIETQKEVIERAKHAAQTAALEKAVGVFIKAHTIVSNAQVAEDLVYAAVRGTIEKLEVIKEGWDPNERERYEISLKALVRPVYPEKGNAISARLSLSRSDLRQGEEVTVFYETNVDAYVYLFSVAADGSVTLLLPNSTDRDNAMRSGRTYQFPPKDSPVHLQAQFLPAFKQSVAEERVTIIATRNKEDIVPLGFQEGMLKVYDAHSTGMISDLVKRLNHLEPTDWTQQTVTYVLHR